MSSLTLSSRCLLQLLLFITAMSEAAGRVDNQFIKQVRVQERVELKCPTQGTDQKLFTEWYKDGQTLIQHSDISTRDNMLIIQRVAMEDAGSYSCQQVDGYSPSATRHNFTIYVYEADVVSFPDNPAEFMSTARPNRRDARPRFVESPPGNRRQDFKAGESQKLRCRATSSPRSQIEWTKNGRSIDYAVEGLVKEGFALKFPNAQFKDRGEYTCRVYNIYGAINYTYTVIITNRMPSAKVIPPFPVNTSVTYGSTASLQCKVRSNSQPTIMWWKEVEDGPIVNGNRRYKLIKNETVMAANEEGAYVNRLVISDVRLEDAGIYVCVGVNRGGGSDAREARLTVGKPRAMDMSTSDPATTGSSWEHIFGSPSATLAVFIAIPVVIILLVTIAVVYGLNKRKKAKRGVRRPPTRVLNDYETSVPLNMNANNGCYSAQFAKGVNNGYKKATMNPQEFQCGDKQYKPPSYKSATPQQYSQYYPSDGSYRSSLHYPQQTHPHQHAHLQDIPDSDSHFSSVSHTRPQYMNNSRNPYDDRDIHSDPPASRVGAHHCPPPPPPGSCYSEQW